MYDPDLEDNLDKKLSELGVGDASFIIVKDDDDDDTPRVDLQLAIEAPTSELDSTGPAMQLVLKEGETLQVPRRPKRKPVDLSVDGMNGSNGEKVPEIHDAPMSTTGKRKRDADEAELDVTEGTPVKKLQLSKPTDEAEFLIIDDEDGAIVLD